jgi:hypothetical protein
MKQKRKPCDQDNSKDLPPQVKNSKYLLAELDLVANIVNSFHIYPKSTSLLQDQVANN